MYCRIATIVTTAVFALSTAASAAVYDTTVLPANYTGSRSLGSGVAGVGANDLTFQIAWTITTISGGFHYSYNLTGGSASSRGLGVSHLLFDLSDNCTSAASGCITNLVVNSSSVDVASLTFDTGTSSNGNPNFPGSITGVRFPGGATPLPMTVSFDSVRVPVWGDFYIKLGNGGTVGGTNGGSTWNTGATLHATSNNIQDFIARPDSVSVSTDVATPEPMTMALVGAALILFGSRKRGMVN